MIASNAVNARLNVFEAITSSVLCIEIATATSNRCALSAAAAAAAAAYVPRDLPSITNHLVCPEH